MNSKSSNIRLVEPYPLTRTLLVKPKDNGKKLLEYLHERFSYIGFDEWKYRLDKRWIWFTNGDAKPDSLLKSNQLIFHHSPRVIEPSVPDLVRVVKETEEWLVAYKPAPMPMHQGGRYYKNTLIYILGEMGYRDLSIVHRLDSVTSGLVLFAKNREMANQLQQAFSEKKVIKWYYALVEGVMSDKKMIVDLPIRRKRGFVFECGTNLKNAKPAKTIIEPCKSVNGLSLVKCTPVTGRTHQIRLHLREAGFPIIDDPIYGSNGDETGNRMQNRAIHLQSSGIVVDDFSIEAKMDLPLDWLMPDE
ncbi:MAG: pseudouridine synthase [Balneolaceae bacterium]